MITKKLGKITFAFDPIAFDGRGYWFVLGKNGGLGRAATEDESKKLRRPKESELYPHRKAEKRAKINPQKEEEEISFEERERLLAEDALRRNRRVRYYGKIAKTTSEYEKAAIVRSKTLGQVASERMLRGQMPIAALKGAFKEKIGARGLAIKEKFDPLNLLNKIPALGGFLSTAYGIKTGRSAADISYFTGAGRFLRQQRQPGQFQDTAIKIPSSENTGSLSASLVGIKTPQGVMKRIYVLLKEWHDEDMRLKEETKRKQEIADNFKEEQDQERHKEMMAALLGKDYKGTKGKGTDKATPQDQKGFFEKLKDELVHDAGLLAAFNAKSLLKFVKNLLPGLAEGLATAFSAEFLATLGGIAGGALFLRQGVKHYKEKFGGAEYTAEQIKVYLILGEWMLLVATDENKEIQGAATVNFINYPASRVAFVTAIGGKLITSPDTFAQMSSIFKANGATKIQGMARPSIARLWKRYGFAERTTLVETRI